jgi:CDGSH-type Zn-finger protein
MCAKKDNLKSVIKITKDGPYLVSNLPLREEIMVCTDDGSPVDWKKGKIINAEKDYALCRCGHSKNKPFCTGEHKKIGFDGTETASTDKFSKNVEVTSGKKLKLLDNHSFCNHSGFCTVGEGVWDGVIFAEDNSSKEKVAKQICNCPTGRLVAVDKKTKKEIEPKFEKSISLITEPEGNGAIWVKGKVDIKSTNGKSLEKRNRVCLCRCGKSNNKPFCDGQHLE